MSKSNVNKLVNPYWEFIGLRELELDNGTSKVELPIKGDLLQRRGTVHGGVIASLIDASIGASIRSLLNEKQAAVTVDMNVNYIRPGVGERLIGQGNVINIGKRIAVGEAKIHNEQGKLIASGTATFMILVKE